MKLCEWCGEKPAALRFCGRKCRQAAWRIRRRRTTAEREGEPGVFAYADPPYPGLAERYYGDQPTFAGEVDHGRLLRALLGALEGDENRSLDEALAVGLGWSAKKLTGFAVSTSVAALGTLLTMLPPYPETRVCAWVKPIPASTRTYGLHNTWEPLIVVGGRRRRPGVRDWLLAQPARLGGSDLPGRKPLAFCAFLFGALGMQPGDELVDMFPGSGAVSRAWAETGRVAKVLNDAPLFGASSGGGDGSRHGANDATSQAALNDGRTQ